MSLRIFHLEEQLERTDVDATHIERVQQRIARCRLQQADLSQSLAEHLVDLAAGRKVLKVYRQMKMYNDATLNPYLYKRARNRSRRRCRSKARSAIASRLTTLRNI